ncbi:MAG: M23 family metallopeptidase [Acidimicrobiales bacterium]
MWRSVRIQLALGAGLLGAVLTTGAGSAQAMPSPTPKSPFEISQGVVRTPPSNTSALVKALAPLQSLGLTAVQADIAGMGHFPVAGVASYYDDWLEYRATPTPHLHEGIDIVAPLGTPIRAPSDGILNYSTTDPDGYGLTAIVTQSDGTYYVMAHMSAVVRGLTGNQAVHTGQVIGFVGDSGDATGPHCHFEIHPLGGPGIDAKPILDLWQLQAASNAPALIAKYQAAYRAAQAPSNVPSPNLALPVIPAIPLPGTTPPGLIRNGALVALHRSRSSPGPAWGSAVFLFLITLLGAAGLAVGSNPMGRAALWRRARRLGSWVRRGQSGAGASP